MLIRNAIQSGNIEDGIERVNDLNPEVLFTVYVLSTQPILDFRHKCNTLLSLTTTETHRTHKVCIVFNIKI